MSNLKSNKFTNIILELLKRPGLATINRVEDFYYIITGFLFCDNDCQNENIEFIKNFEKFVINSLGLKENTTWSTAIRFYSADDIRSLELFETLFKDFLEKQELG